MDAKISTKLQCADSMVACARFARSNDEQLRELYLASLRGAGAVLDVVEAKRHRLRPGNAWQRLAKCSPEFSLWASRFAPYSRLRTESELGTRVVSAETVSELHALVLDFLDAVADFLVYHEGVLYLKSGIRTEQRIGTLAS